MRIFSWIMFYESSISYVTQSNNENVELTKQLWNYHTDLGVEAYEADTDDLRGTVKWHLQDKWYTTSEIERIKSLKAFL